MIIFHSNDKIMEKVPVRMLTDQFIAMEQKKQTNKQTSHREPQKET